MPSKKFLDSYTTKKTISNGLMDGALLATNAAQLKILLTDKIDDRNTGWIVSLIMVSISLFAQIIMAVLIGLLAQNKFSDKNKERINKIMNNIVLALTGIVFLTNIVTNIFIQVDITDYLSKLNKTDGN